MWVREIQFQFPYHPHRPNYLFCLQPIRKQYVKSCDGNVRVNGVRIRLLQTGSACGAVAYLLAKGTKSLTSSFLHSIKYPNVNCRWKHAESVYTGETNDWGTLFNDECLLKYISLNAIAHVYIDNAMAQAESRCQNLHQLCSETLVECIELQHRNIFRWYKSGGDKSWKIFNDGSHRAWK